MPTSDLNTVGAMYASSTNPCRFDGSGNLDANGSIPASCTALSSGTAAAGATSFGFSFQPATPFEADEWLRITVAVGILGNPPGCDDPLCDGDTLDTDAIAWNSFAFGGVYDDSASGSRFLDSEPIQVGLKMIDTSTQTSLGNYIWYDENNDGLQGAYETPLAGVTVSLYESDGITLIEKTLTSSDGFYRFNGLTPSSIYVIKLDNPDDFTSGALSGMTLTTQDVNGNANDSIDSDGSYVGTTPVITATVGVVTGVDVLTDPSEYPTNDFGFWLPASIGDTVWFDDDGFGDQTPGEGGVSGVTVNLYYPDGTLAGSTTTDADGEYAFTNLVPGYYYVDIDETTLPANYKFTTQDGTGDDTNDSDADSTGQMALTLLDPGENDPSWDAGITPLPTNPAEIGNKVWLDIDKDGIQDGGEPGVTGVTVQLVDNNGLLVSATTTDSNGEYMFTGLEPSDYKVIILPPAGYSMTTKDASGSTDANDSDADPLTGEMDLTLLDPGESDPDWDAGLISSLDWGDLPDTDVSGSYPTNNANLGEGVGASHVVYGNSDDGTPDGSGAIWLGATVDTEGNGQPNAGASNDGSDEDGVQTNLADWDNGTNGGQVDVTVTGGTGYLVGWFDLNGDGVFDTVAHQSVLAGSNSVNVDIPDGTFSPDGTLGGSNINVFARFRLFENEAAALLMADGTIDETHGYTGIASNGEVEDYMWTFSPTSVSMKQVSSNSDSGSFTLVWVAVGLMLLTGWVYWRKQRSPSV